MCKPLRLSLASIQPSQLYVSEAKLAAVEVWWDDADLDALTPIPVVELDGVIVASDGHTRAFAAHRAGYDAVPIVWDTDELDWEAYRICVNWCRGAGVRSVADLEGRVLPAEDYEVLWLDRCRVMHARLREGAIDRNP